MMALIKDGRLVKDPYRNCTDMETLPGSGALIVSVEQWQDHWEKLDRRGDPIGCG